MALSGRNKERTMTGRAWNERKRLWVSRVAVVLVIGLWAWGVAMAAPQAGGSTPGGQAAAGEYVGPATCISCHETEAAGYNAGPHSRVWDPRTPAAARACETCHGAGRTHVDDPGVKGAIRNPAAIGPRDASAICTTCHNRQEHAAWEGSMHDARNVSCVTCHSVHAPKSETGHLKQASVTATCAQCHPDKAARLLRSGHMPVREGKMECTSCHNQHGSPNVRMLRAGNDVTSFCVSCHTEKRGPFLWEHAPVRENCATCHDPHGSSNDRMLVAKQPMLCQRCHIFTRHPSTIYDAAAVTAGNNRIVNRGCVNCHSNIHGSNHPSGMMFQR